MASGESTFLCYVRIVLKKWTGLQLAIIEGMGGPYAREKELWFGSEIENFFKNNDNLLPCEIEEFMSEILNAEFDVVVEDESLTEMSKDFCRIFELCVNGLESEVMQLLDKMSTPTMARVPLPAVISETSDINGPGQEEECCAEIQLRSQIEKLSVSDGYPDEVDMSEGWTQVRRGRRRK